MALHVVIAFRDARVLLAQRCVERVSKECYTCVKDLLCGQVN